MLKFTNAYNGKTQAYSMSNTYSPGQLLGPGRFNVTRVSNPTNIDTTQRTAAVRIGGAPQGSTPARVNLFANFPGMADQAYADPYLRDQLNTIYNTDVTQRQAPMTPAQQQQANQGLVNSFVNTANGMAPISTAQAPLPSITTAPARPKK